MTSETDKNVQAFWFLAVLVGLPFPLMLLVNVDRGRADAIALADTLEQLARERDGYVGDVDEDIAVEQDYSYQRS